MRQDGPARFAQPLAEQGMSGVGLRFRYPAQAVEFGGGAAAQIAMLWEDEPHPVALLVAGAELRQRLFEDTARLRIGETLQAERIGREPGIVSSRYFASAFTAARVFATCSL